MPSAPHIRGYAAISEDGMLANAEGVMPDALKLDADQRFFERGLDCADILVHGRHSSESGPRTAQRRRLIVTTEVKDIAVHPTNPRARLWNPKGAAFSEALAAIGAPNANIAILGGTNVFELFLEMYETFYLSRVAEVWLPGGRPVFTDVPMRRPEDVLAAHDMAPSADELSTPKLKITPWRRQSAD